VLGRLFCFCLIDVDLVSSIESAISQNTVAFKSVFKVPSNPQTSSNIERPVSKECPNQSEQFKGTSNDYVLLVWCQ
jgi:hypothetical protein